MKLKSSDSKQQHLSSKALAPAEKKNNGAQKLQLLLQKKIGAKKLQLQIWFYFWSWKLKL